MAIQPIFRAEWPASLDPVNKPWYERACQIGLFALQIIFAPVYVGYLFCKKLASYAILPSHHLTQTIAPRAEARLRAQVQEQIDRSNQPQSREITTRCTFETPDGAKLDGLLVRSRQVTSASSKVILCPMPNGVRYEEFFGTLLGLFRGDGRARAQRPLQNLITQPPRSSRTQRPHSNIHQLSDLRSERPDATSAHNLLDGLSQLMQTANSLLQSLAANSSNPTALNGFGEVMQQVAGNGPCVDPNVSVFFFNYRGVGQSRGSPYTDKLPLDVYSAYEYLIHEHEFAAEDIALYGCSMGGAAGSIGASLVQEKYADAMIGGVADSTFSNLSTEVQEVLGCFGTPGSLALRGLNLDLRVHEAWERLRGHKAALHNRHDPVVPYSASLINANPRGATLFLQGWGHGVLSSQDGRQAIVRHLRQALQLA